jgi:hypothetical protein
MPFVAASDARNPGTSNAVQAAPSPVAATPKTNEEPERRVGYGVLLGLAACIVVALILVARPGTQAETARPNPSSRPAIVNQGPSKNAQPAPTVYNTNNLSFGSNATNSLPYKEYQGTNFAPSPNPPASNTAWQGGKSSGQLSTGVVNDATTSLPPYATTSLPSYKLPSVSNPGLYYDYNYRPPVGEHYVQGHIRRDGTYVQGHYQTNPDNSFWNNWSSKGNVNPHTGKVGTRLPATSHSRR